MNQINFYETIFKRKSVRKYDFTPLDNKTMLEIQEFAKKINNLYKNIKTEIKFGGEDEVNGLLFKVKAPHYIVMFSENKDGYLTNAGFMLQQIDLFLSSKGLGSCYLGMTQPAKALGKSEGMDFIMVLAFGKPAEEVHRTNISEFKRKALSEISNITVKDDLLEAARLAPSATNSQPWYFTSGEGIIHSYCVKNNFIRAMAYDRLNKFDMGIALCHIVTAAEYAGRKIEFTHDKTAQEKHPGGYYYIISAILK